MIWSRTILLIIAWLAQYLIMHLFKSVAEYWAYISLVSVLLFIIGSQIVITKNRNGYAVATTIFLVAFVPFLTLIPCVWIFDQYRFSRIVFGMFESAETFFLHLVFFSGWIYALFLCLIWYRVKDVLTWRTFCLLSCCFVLCLGSGIGFCLFQNRL